MSQGYSKEACMGHLGIAKQTFYNWMESHSEFLDAVKEGELQSMIWWERKGMEGMTGQIQNFNATTWIFNMKNRHNWADKTATDITSDGKAITGIAVKYD